jgi:DNA-binding beta-propeller fold protein YncE
VFLSKIGHFRNGTEWDAGAAEIVAFDSQNDRIFVTNAETDTIDVLDASDPTALSLVDSLDLAAGGDGLGGPNSVAVSNGLVAVAVENDDSAANGWIYFYNASTLAFISRVEVGNLPDMVTFSPDGSVAIVANEGEPASDYQTDPEGSVSIVAISGGQPATSATTIGFTDFNEGGSRADEAPGREDGFKLFGNFGCTMLAVTDATEDTVTVTDPDGVLSTISVGDFLNQDESLFQVVAVDAEANTITLNDEPDASAPIYLHDGASSFAQDVEPEYIAVSADSSTAFVSLQENNGLAVIDIADASITAVVGLGTKDHYLPGNEIDPSDRDGGAYIWTWEIEGMFMPDSIATYSVGGQTFVLTANEGDAREYEAFTEEARFKDVEVDENAVFDVEAYGVDEQLGRIATTIWGDEDGDGVMDIPYVYGARSFSIWSDEGQLIWDSGADMELITAQRFGDDFNSNNDVHESDTRSDAKGPEPEAIDVGQVGNSWYAFVGAERMGGIFVYDITQPHNPTFVQYVNNRDLSIEQDSTEAAENDTIENQADYAPEGIDFVSAADSPTGVPLIIVGNEVSGTTAVYEITVVPAGAAELIKRQPDAPAPKTAG